MALFEEDPAADFLTREQEAIGDVLGGDNFELIADNSAADQGLDLDSINPEELVKTADEVVSEDHTSQKDAIFDDTGSGFESPDFVLGDNPQAGNEGPLVYDEGQDFLEDAPVAMPPADSEPEILAAPVMSEPEIVPSAVPTAVPTAVAAAPVYEALAEAAEPESIRKWRQEQAEEIAARDAEAEAKRAEWKAEAAKELENWHSKQNEVLAKTKAGNREAQEAFLSENKETKEGAQWESICKLCDFNPKSNRNCKDTSRMRSIFLQLKQNPLVR